MHVPKAQRRRVFHLLQQTDVISSLSSVLHAMHCTNHLASHCDNIARLCTTIY